MFGITGEDWSAAALLLVLCKKNQGTTVEEDWSAAALLLVLCKKNQGTKVPGI